MASYNELNALIDAYINRNGVQAITGQILNGVLKAMVEQLGRGYTIMGAATPATDPGTPDGPECYFASEVGTYTDFDGLQIVPGELALLCYTPSGGWTKETIYEGFQEVQATIDGNVGTPFVGVSYANGVLSFDFHNMKGNPGQNGQDGQDGDPAGFGTIGADITGGVGTPGVTVESSGPATAKNLQFHFTNLKGETGVTSVVATVDNTTGTPTCTVSLAGQQLTLAFSGLKGEQGNTGSSVDYPFTIVNNLTTDDATQALSAAQGVVLDGKVTQLEAEVDELDNAVNGGTADIQYTDDQEGKILYVNGLLYSTPSQSYHTRTFPVIEGKTYKISGRVMASSLYENACLCCFYDSNGDFIAGSQRGLAGDSTTAYTDEEIVAPAGAESVKVTGNIVESTPNAPAVKYDVEGIESRISTLENNEQNIAEDIAQLSSEVESLEEIESERELGEYAKDRLGDASLKSDYFLDIYGEEQGPTSDWCYYTLQVFPGQKFKVTAYAGQNARLWLALNGSSIVSKSTDSSTVGYKEETVTIPENANALVVNGRRYNATEIASIGIMQLFPGITANAVLVSPTKNIKEYVDENIGGGQPNNILYGKTLVCCGDSITHGADMDAPGITQVSSIDVYQSNIYGDWVKKTDNFLKTYGYQIAERNNMTFYNGGIDGSTTQGIAEKNGFSLANGRYTKLPDNLDYLVIFFGWNDTAYGTLGTINDSTNESYYGGYNVVMPYLINKYPYAKIALIVPFGTDEGHRNAIRELANKWGVACFDMYQGGTPLYYGKEPSVGVDASIVTANRAKFQANNAHPNFAGHRQIGDMLEHFLRGI